MGFSGRAGRRPLAWAFSVCLGIFSLAVGVTRAAESEPVAGNTIVLIGSSIAAGVGASVYDSAWAGKYAASIKALNPTWTFVSLAVPGYTTYNVMRTGNVPPANRATPDTVHNITKAISLKPTCLIISLTGNDIANGYAPAEYEENFDSLRALAVRAGIKVWITTPTPRTAVDSAKRVRILALRDRVLSRYAPRAIDFYDSLGAADGTMIPKFNSGDGIHPNNLGHAMLFRRMLAANVPGITIGLRRRSPVPERERMGLPIFSAADGSVWMRGMDGSLNARRDGLGRNFAPGEVSR